MLTVMEKSTATFLALAAFFCGVTLGFLIAPMKNGITIGSQIGNNNQIGQKDEPDEYDEDDEEDYAF